MQKHYLYNKYTVIVGDIIDSKNIMDRKNAQTRFKKILSEINIKYSNDIASKFIITLGDEFQGLLKNSNNIMKIIFEIEMAMSPIALRFGVGIGDINTDINLQYSTEIDGPSYHRARAMLEELEKIESQYSKRQANILISSQEENAVIDKLLNSILSVCTSLKSKWTLRQKEIIRTYLLSEENQYKTAEKLGIGQSSISKALSSASFYTYKSAMDNINSFLVGKGMD